MTGPGELRAKAEWFADKLTRVTQGVVGPDCVAFEARAIERPNQTTFVVSQPSGFIQLMVNNKPLLAVQASYFCRISGLGHMKVEKSTIVVFPFDGARAKPLVRYDFIDAPNAKIPAAHVQFHATHPELDRAMENAGRATRGGRKLQKKFSKAGAAPDASNLHFPVGGRRFRPELEDVLEMLVHEFGIDHEDNFEAAIVRSRREWRAIQLRAAIQDAPDVAVSELKNLGYLVKWCHWRPPPQRRPHRFDEL